MSKKTFDARTQYLHEIIGGDTAYKVPKFQRDYSWQHEQWQDLWQDIIDQIEDKFDEDGSHYMGYLVLQKSGNREFQVIDGQQRLTTITILIIAVLQLLEDKIKNQSDEEAKKNDQERLDELRRKYIGISDPVSLVVKNKLTLNKNNKNYFSDLCRIAARPAMINIGYSNRLLIKALKFFKEKIAQTKHSENSESLARFVEKVCDVLFFTLIEVSDDLNAYKVFETLNSRGVKLSTSDLLKNYLFSSTEKKGELAQSEEEIEWRWSRIIETLKESDFSNFVRADWNNKNSPVTQNQLFRAIKQKLIAKDQIFAYIRNLDETSEIYAALDAKKNYNEEFWEENFAQDEVIKSKGLFEKMKDYLKTLKIFGFHQPYSFLMTAYQNFSKEEFCKILGYIDTISMRYNVIGERQPNRQETIYQQLALKISNKEITNLAAIKEMLKEVYPSDEDFIHDFKKKR